MVSYPAFTTTRAQVVKISMRAGYKARARSAMLGISTFEDIGSCAGCGHPDLQPGQPRLESMLIDLALLLETHTIPEQDRLAKVVSCQG